MGRCRGLVVIGLVAACNRATGSFQGRLVEMSGQPVAGVTVVATPDATVDGCPELSAATFPDGAFTLDRTCRGVQYTLATRDPAWTLLSAPPIAGGSVPREEMRIYASATRSP